MTGVSIQITTRGLRVGVSGVFWLLCLCKFQFPSCWLGSALCAEQCLRQRGSFDFNDTVFGGMKTMGNVVGYVGEQRRVVVQRWAKAVARELVGVLVGDSEWSEDL